jgi:hypothetical protein
MLYRRAANLGEKRTGVGVMRTRYRNGAGESIASPTPSTRPNARLATNGSGEVHGVYLCTQLRRVPLDIVDGNR